MRLSPFAGTFDLTAAEAVCCGGVVDEFDVADPVDELVDQSLVSLAGRGSTYGRYQMPEPIRQCAEQLLVDPDSLRERHASYFAGLAEVAYEAMWTAAEAEWIQRLEADFANHQVAYQFWVSRGELGAALTIAISLNQPGELALQSPAGAEILFGLSNSTGSKPLNSDPSPSPTQRSRSDADSTRTR